MLKVVNELKSKNPSWREIRQIIANANVNDFEEFYRYLYDNVEEYLPGKEGTVAIYLNEFAYQSQFRIDKEINLMALIAHIIETKKQNVIL